MFPGLLVD